MRRSRWPWRGGCGRNLEIRTFLVPRMPEGAVGILQDPEAPHGDTWERREGGEGREGRKRERKKKEKEQKGKKKTWFVRESIPNVSAEIDQLRRSLLH